MSTVKSSAAAKAAAAVLLVICTAAFAASLAGMVAMDAMGIYQANKEELIKERFDDICMKYSVAALAGYEDDFNMQELSETNWKYGVLKTGDDKEADADYLSPSENYVVRNFDELPGEEDLNIYECNVNQNTCFTYGKNIWDSFYTVQNEQAEYIDATHPWEYCVYNVDTESFYLVSGTKLYPVEEGYISTKYEESIDLEYFSNEFLTERENENKGVNRIAYEWEDICRNGSLFGGAGIQIDMSEISIIDQIDLERLGEVSDEFVDTYDEQTVYTQKKKKPKYEHYTVVSFVNEPLQGEQSFLEGDMFVQMRILVDFIYRMRYPAIAVLIVSLVGMAAAFCFLMSSAGHHRGQEKISLRLLDKLPLDLYLAGVCAAELMLMAAVAVFANAVGYGAGPDSSGFVSFCVLSVCAGIAGILLAVGYCMSFAVHVKLGKWWKNTCIYWIFGKCMKLISVCIGFCMRILKSLFQSIPLLWKVWIGLGLLAFLECAFLLFSYQDTAVAFWLLEKIILYPAVIIVLLQMNKLQKGAQRIANGELNYQIDTSYMFWETRKHGEYLNAIGIGMNHAVNERMKSERFKTELITNVSHDIKTPLTSIINYVDLLEKEQIENPTVQEYLEVLHRQSARLKKLIEDLMEASKASSGSLNVVMEECDAGVMLVQTVGEFEEKLMQNQIELQIKRPEEHIFIEADSRHLWRVFDNLMNNICKYAQPMTRAYVNLEQNGQQAVIIFRNISKCQLNISSEELMERFVRGDSSRNTEGSGLGISIAKSLTELMNGSFELIVDGDLFKVVLLFPLYGSVYANQGAGESFPALEQELTGKKEKHILGGVSAGIQKAGAHAAGLGRGVADKTGRMVNRAGRFVHHVRQALEQTKAEEAAMAAGKAESDLSDGAVHGTESHHQM